MRWIEKRPLPKYLLGDDPLLDVAFRYWSNKRQGGLLPARADVDTPAFRMLSGEGNWIEIRRDEPKSWSLGPLAPFAGLPGVTIDATLGEMLLTDIKAVAYTGSILFQAIRVGDEDDPDLYHMLLLPHATDGRRVGEVLMLASLVTAPAPQPFVPAELTQY